MGSILLVSLGPMPSRSLFNECHSQLMKHSQPVKPSIVDVIHQRSWWYDGFTVVTSIRFRGWQSSPDPATEMLECARLMMLPANDRWHSLLL